MSIKISIRMCPSKQLGWVISRMHLCVYNGYRRSLDIFFFLLWAICFVEVLKFRSLFHIRAEEQISINVQPAQVIATLNAIKICLFSRKAEMKSMPLKSLLQKAFLDCIRMWGKDAFYLHNISVCLHDWYSWNLKYSVKGRARHIIYCLDCLHITKCFRERAVSCYFRVWPKDSVCF